MECPVNGPTLLCLLWSRGHLCIFPGYLLLIKGLPGTKYYLNVIQNKLVEGSSEKANITFFKRKKLNHTYFYYFNF